MLWQVGLPPGCVDSERAGWQANDNCSCLGLVGKTQDFERVDPFQVFWSFRGDIDGASIAGGTVFSLARVFANFQARRAIVSDLKKLKGLSKDVKSHLVAIRITDVGAVKPIGDTLAWRAFAGCTQRQRLVIQGIHFLFAFGPERDHVSVSGVWVVSVKGKADRDHRLLWGRSDHSDPTCIYQDFCASFGKKIAVKGLGFFEVRNADGNISNHQTFL